MDDTEDLIRAALRHQAAMVTLAPGPPAARPPRGPHRGTRWWLAVAAACFLTATVAVVVSVIHRTASQALTVTTVPVAADSPLAGCIDPHPTLPHAVAGAAAASFRGTTLTRSLVLDGGAFRADPPTGHVRAIDRSIALCNAMAGISDENSALLGSAAHQGMSFALAWVTIADRVATGSNPMVPTRAHVQRFHHRLAWIAVFAPLVVAFCPRIPARSRTGHGPPALVDLPDYQIMIIDATTGVDGVRYSGRQHPLCGGVQFSPPSVSLAVTAVSVPWTLLYRGPGPQAAMISYRPRPCDSRVFGYFLKTHEPAVLASRDHPGLVGVGLERTLARCGPAVSVPLLLRSATLKTNLPSRLVHATVGAQNVGS